MIVLRLALLALIPLVVGDAHAERAAIADANRRHTHRRRDLRPLTDRQVEGIARLAPAEWESTTGGHLEKLLVPRVSGTENNTRVQEYISSVFSGLGWHEDKYAKRMPTPLGEKLFTNLVYTFDPGAPRKLVLSAHFDSKYFEEGGFIGATDSAAPCATMIDVAEALTPLLTARAARLRAGKPLNTSEVDEAAAAEVTLQIVFFDGEEAFVDWTATDSVYGSRHLAETWQKTLLRPDHALAREFEKRRLGSLPNVLDSMDVLVLLDLLGAPKPRMRSFYPETRWLFSALQDADRRLRAAELVDATDDKWFSDRPGMPGAIDDDHRPFLLRGVPILHLISLPFPLVWHTMLDNADVLDLGVLRRWNRIMRVFAASYLHLSADDDKAASTASTASARSTKSAKSAENNAAAPHNERAGPDDSRAERSELVRTPPRGEPQRDADGSEGTET